MLPLPIIGRKWPNINIDFIIELPRTSTWINAITTIVDIAMKMVHLVSTTTEAIASESVELFKSFIWKYYGISRSICSDKDAKFISLLLKNLIKILGTKIQMSTTFHPQMNRQNKRINDLVEQVLRTHTP